MSRGQGEVLVSRLGPCVACVLGPAPDANIRGHYDAEQRTPRDRHHLGMQGFIVRSTGLSRSRVEAQSAHDLAI